MKSLERLLSIFPNDADPTSGRMWPVYSARWQPPAHSLDRTQLPTWTRWAEPGAAIPLNRTQRAYTLARRSAMAEQAMACAWATAHDPIFRSMAERFGRVMIGGLIHGPVHRLGRHLYASILCHLFPDVQLWLLGQASPMVCLTA